MLRNIGMATRLIGSNSLKQETIEIIIKKIITLAHVLGEIVNNLNY